MHPTKNLHRGLKTTIDIGGQLFDLYGDETVRSSHYSYNDFLKTFNKSRYGNIDVEYLLRRYLPVGQNIDEIIFDDDDEYKDLIKVINIRIQQLKESEQFLSTVVANTPISKYYYNLVNDVLPRLKKRSETKTTVIPKLTENEIFQMILEMSWYLSHPKQVPRDIEQNWAAVVERFKDKRITDLVQTIRQLEEEKGIPHEEKPLRYFKKLDMDEVKSSSTLQGAMDRVAQMATVVDAEPIKPQMEQRLKDLISVLQLKQYIDKSDPVNNSGIPIVNTNRLSSNLQSNPRAASASSSAQSGGKTPTSKKVISTLSAPLGQAMLPFFDYFKELYDPVYRILEKGITHSIQRAVLPHILLLLHLCNEFNNPSISVKREHGLYHIQNISEEAVIFLSEQLQKMDQATSEMSKDEEKEVFRKQLFELPNLRLRSLIKNDGSMPAAINQQQSIFNLQFFVVGINLILPTLEEFNKKHQGKVDSSVYTILKNNFPDGSVFLSYTDASTRYKDFPLQFFQVDFNEIKVNDPTIAIQSKSPELDSLIKDGLVREKDDKFLDKLMVMKPYMNYNYPLLALSVLIALKHRMPK